MDALKNKLHKAEEERAEAGKVSSRLEQEKTLLERELAMMRSMWGRITCATPQAWPGWAPPPSQPHPQAPQGQPPLVPQPPQQHSSPAPPPQPVQHASLSREEDPDLIVLSPSSSPITLPRFRHAAAFQTEPMDVKEERDPPVPFAPSQIAFGKYGNAALFDAHFHLDRLANSKGKKRDISDLLRKEVEGNPSQWPLQGGVIVFCDPDTFPSEMVIQSLRSQHPSFAIALGIHPTYSKHFDKYSESISNIKGLLSKGKIQALGEIGFDFLKGGPRIYQESLVSQAIIGVDPKHPIIFHIRGNREDLNGDEAYVFSLSFLRSRLDASQAIQLHSFSGSQLSAKKFMEAFPNCHFSFSGLIRHFNREQKEALRSIPNNRLLFETDSPYLTVLKHVKKNHPCYLGEVVKLAAEIREQTVSTLLKINQANSLRLFNLK